MIEYNSFNPITLTFFDVLNAFHVSIEVVYTICHIPGSISVGKCVRHLKKS